MDLARRVEREGACLLRLCGDLTEYIKSGRSTKTYLFETDEFLEYINKALATIEAFITALIAEKIEPGVIESKLRDLGHIKIVLSWLYSLSKEAIDADSLSIPFSLVTFLNHTARELQKCKDVSLVVIGSSELNYFKFNLKPQRDLSEHLAASVISDYPILSEKIGILKFPYCASDEVLVNCDLFHELGHYIYESTDLERKFYGKIENGLLQFATEHSIHETVQDGSFLWRKLLNYVRALLLNWADEVFADTFAIVALGPAFHLAYLEIEQIMPMLTPLDLADLASRGVSVETMRKAKRVTFSETHPATDFRFRVHAKSLRDTGWDETMDQRVPDVFSELKRCSQLTVDDFVLGCVSPLQEYKELETKLHKWVLKTFEDIIVTVEERVREKLVGLPRPFEDFDNYDAGVTACLAHGVVPSTITADGGAIIHPSPTTLLNSGFFFYLGGMRDLLGRVRLDSEPTEKRIRYERRLNHWLAKAIDDLQIVRRELRP